MVPSNAQAYASGWAAAGARLGCGWGAAGVKLWQACGWLSAAGAAHVQRVARLCARARSSPGNAHIPRLYDRLTYNSYSCKREHRSYPRAAQHRRWSGCPAELHTRSALGQHRNLLDPCVSTCVTRQARSPGVQADLYFRPEALARTPSAAWQHIHHYDDPQRPARPARGPHAGPRADICELAPPPRCAGGAAQLQGEGFGGCPPEAGARPPAEERPAAAGKRSARPQGRPPGR